MLVKIGDFVKFKGFSSGILREQALLRKAKNPRTSSEKWIFLSLAHQNRAIAITSDFRVDGAKSPEIPQKEGVLCSEIAARNRKSLATFHRTLKLQCNIASSCLGNRAISGVRDGHRNRKSQKSLRFRCAKFPSLAFYNAPSLHTVDLHHVLGSRLPLWDRPKFRNLPANR